MGDILISGGNPFSVVALDQPFIGPALDHQRQCSQARFSASWMPEFAPRRSEG